MSKPQQKGARNKGAVEAGGKKSIAKRPTAKKPPSTTARESIAASGPVAGRYRSGAGPVVLQVLPELATGGAERGAVDIALALAEAGGTSLVASAGGAMVRELERAEIRHLKLPVDSKNPVRMYRNAAVLEALVREHNVDILHVRSRAPAWSALRAARRTGCALVTTFHGTYNRENRLKELYNSVMVRGDRVIAISEFIAQHIRDNYPVDPDRIRVVNRGVDLDVFDPAKVSAARIIQLADRYGLPEDQPVILLPGRLTRWKGQGVFIEAIARLGRRDVCPVVMGGDQGRTGYRSELEAQARAGGLESLVRFTDHCDDMAAALMVASVVVSASTDPEAFGRVLAEAQAMGRPVIGPDHGGAREIVLPGKTGWLVPPGDPDALAAAITEVLAMSPLKRKRRGNVAAAHVRESFSKAAMCAATFSVYDEVMAERGRRQKPQGS